MDMAGGEENPLVQYFVSVSWVVKRVFVFLCLTYFTQYNTL